MSIRGVGLRSTSSEESNLASLFQDTQSHEKSSKWPQYLPFLSVGILYHSDCHVTMQSFGLADSIPLVKNFNLVSTTATLILPQHQQTPAYLQALGPQCNPLISWTVCPTETFISSHLTSSPPHARHYHWISGFPLLWRLRFQSSPTNVSATLSRSSKATKFLGKVLHHDPNPSKKLILKTSSSSSGYCSGTNPESVLLSRSFSPALYLSS